MRILNSPYLAALLLVGFILLAIVSTPPYMETFINDKVSQYDSSKTLTYAQTKERHRAKALQELWEITDNEISKPVRLW
jgi:hypothetical protein